MERFQRWISALEGKGLNVNVGKTKMVVSVQKVKWHSAKFMFSWYVKSMINGYVGDAP